MNRRDINVDGILYRWFLKNTWLSIWDHRNRKRLFHVADVKTPPNDEDVPYSITPSDVAEFIRKKY